MKYSLGGKVTVLIVYVDDIILMGDNVVGINHLKKGLATEFEIKDLGALRYFLGLEIARSKKGIIFSQQKYMLDLLKKMGMSGCRPSNTFIDPNVKLGKVEIGVLVDTTRYQNLVGKLIYLSHTQPNIAL